MNYINKPENKNRKENFIKLRDYLGDRYGDDETADSFDMGYYSMGEDSKSNFISYDDYIESWHYCFSSDWPSNIQQAINRLTAFIDDKIDPENDDWFYTTTFDKNGDIITTIKQNESK